MQTLFLFGATEASVNPIASLSSNGYITSVPEAVDYLMACLCANNASQSNLTGKVPSFSAVLQNFSGDIRGLENGMAAMVIGVFSQHFESVGATCHVRPYTPAELNGRTPHSGEQVMELRLNFIDDGTSYSLGGCLKQANGRLSNFTRFEIL